MSADALYEGPITMTRKGFGFFAIPVGELPDGSPATGDKEDLLIPPEHTNHALSGDIVKIASIGSYRDPSSRNYAFNLMVKKYQQKIYWHIRKMVIDHDDTDDVGADDDALAPNLHDLARRQFDLIDRPSR